MSDEAPPRLESVRIELDGAEPGRSAARAQNASSSRSHWRQLLAGASPREVLARLMNGDPLGLRGKVVERLRARSLLLDADRALLRAFARTARFALRYRGEPALDAWLAGLVDEALGDLLREEAEWLRRGSPGGSEVAAFNDLARPLGLEPGRMRAACAAFNQLPDGDRRAFYALLIEGRSLDDLARESGESASSVARAARRGLEVVMQPAARPPETALPKAAPEEVHP